MNNATRPLLTLPKAPTNESLEDRTFILDVFDLLLPCRSFQVAYKVAEVGKVSLTTEFLLRLLRSVDGMDEDSVAIFFGFDRRELSFVLNEAESHDYVVRRAGRLWLTETGRGLFMEGDEEPHIYDVEKRVEWVDFDLISLAPQSTTRLSRFEVHLPELHIQDSDGVSSAAERVRKSAFKKHYSEIATRRDSAALEKRSLYSVDDVTAGERRFAPIQVIVRSRVDRPGAPEPDLSFWRSGHELDDRAAVLERAAAFLEDRKVSPRTEDAAAYQVLLDLAPEFLKDFTRRDGLAVERYYREWVGRPGGFRSDRKTIPIIGSLFTPANYDRLVDGLSSAKAEREDQPGEFYWLLPRGLWGTTNALPLALKTIKRDSQSDEAPEGAQAIAVLLETPPLHIKAVFDKALTLPSVAEPPALELLVIPGVLAAALVHAPLKRQSGVPVPLGFVSYEPQVVMRAHRYLSCRMPEE